MNGLRMHHLHPFSKKKIRRGHPPPHAKGKHSPASRISEIGDLKAKLHTIFEKKNQQTIGKNGLMHRLHPLFKHFLGDTSPP